jgi:hypothetical protein
LEDNWCGRRFPSPSAPDPAAPPEPTEFEKGKAAVSVPAVDKLPSVIDMLIKAVVGGELNQQLAAVGAGPLVQKITLRRSASQHAIPNPFCRHNRATSDALKRQNLFITVYYFLAASS